jgi:hypothetical protein
MGVVGCSTLRYIGRTYRISSVRPDICGTTPLGDNVRNCDWQLWIGVRVQECRLSLCLNNIFNLETLGYCYRHSVIQTVPINDPYALGVGGWRTRINIQPRLPKELPTHSGTLGTYHVRHWTIAIMAGIGR